jgi:hypothetical protein
MMSRENPATDYTDFHGLFLKNPCNQWQGFVSFALNGVFSRRGFTQNDIA